MKQTIKSIKVGNLTIEQREDGIEILKENEVFGIVLTWEDLRFILQSLQLFSDPEIEELQKLVEKTPS